MKVKTPSLLKKIITALSNKTKDLRIRIMIFFLLHKNIDKSSLTHSLQALVSQPLSHNIRNHVHLKDEDVSLLDDNNDTLLIHYNKSALVSEDGLMIRPSSEREEEQGGGNDEDLTHAILEELEAEMEEDVEEEMVGGGGGGGGDGGEVVAEAVEEEDIDQAADMFIQRFKRQIQLQKQLSLERHQTNVLLSNA